MKYKSYFTYNRALIYHLVEDANRFSLAKDIVSTRISYFGKPIKIDNQLPFIRYKNPFFTLIIKQPDALESYTTINVKEHTPLFKYLWREVCHVRNYVR